MAQMSPRGKNLSIDSLLIQRGPDQTQSARLPGIYRGIVENNEDPFGIGRCQVRVFSIHGAASRLPTAYLPWAAPGDAFSVPDVSERVWVMFENGIRYKPVYLGRRLAVPAGKGFSRPSNQRAGSEVPREAWSHKTLKPTASLVARTREGSAIWTEDAELGGTFRSRISLQDTGGAALSLESYIYSSEDFEATSYDPARTENGGNNDTEYRKKELLHRSQMGRAGRIRIGQPGAGEQWSISRDQVVMGHRETESQDGVYAVSQTAIDGGLSVDRVGHRKPEAHTSTVRTPGMQAQGASRLIALAAPNVSLLPPRW